MNKRVDYDHLYVDQKGLIRDSHLENLFDDVLFGKNDGVTRNNLQVYTQVMYSDRKIDTSVIWDDVVKAADFACRLSYLSLWLLDTNDLNMLESNLAKIKPRWGAKLGDYRVGQPVVGKTMHHAIILAVVQHLREIAVAVNNENMDQPTH